MIGAAWYELRLQAIAFVAWLVGIPFERLVADYDPEPETEAETDNPFVDDTVARLMYNSFDSLTMSAWPAAHRATGMARISVEVLLAHQIGMFDGLSLQSLKGAGYEISRLYGDILTEFEPGEIIGTNWQESTIDMPPGMVSMREELFGFAAESSEGNHTAAANVAEAVYRRFYPGGDDTTALLRVNQFLSHLLVSLSYRFAELEIPQLGETP